MRSPSARCLINRVDLYRFVATKDAAGGIAGNPYGTPFATSVACSVQPAAPERTFDFDTGRLIQKNMWNVMFNQDYSLRTDDKIVWVDTAGATRNLFVYGNADQAGRGGAFVAQCEERL
jgi:hypothetical protein